MPYEFAALGAALCWTVTGFIAVTPARHLGAIAFTRIRMSIIFVLMTIWVWLADGFVTVPESQLGLLLCSGLIGIFIGDTALFTAMTRLGPRRTGLLFASNAPMTVLIAWFWFDERLNLQQLSGCLLVTIGVAIAIGYAKRDNNAHRFEKIQGPLWIGVLLGLIAALCQAVGALMSKPALAAGADPIAVTAIRIGIAAVALNLSLLLPIKAQKMKNPLTMPMLGKTVLTGLIGMALAMSLLMYAFAHGNAGLSTILSSTAPVLVLPVLWFLTRIKPSIFAWLGAIICFVGTVFILVG